MIPTTHFLVLAAVLFMVGLVGVIVRRNILVVLMCVELMLNSANMTLIAFARAHGQSSAQGIAFLVMAMAAAEAAVGLAIVVAVFRVRRTVNVDEINLLRK